MKIIEKYYHVDNGGFTFALNNLQDDLFEFILAYGFHGYSTTTFIFPNLSLENIIDLAIFLMKSGRYEGDPKETRKEFVLFQWEKEIDGVKSGFYYWLDSYSYPSFVLEIETPVNFYSGVELSRWDKSADFAIKIFNTLISMEASWSFDLEIPEKCRLKVNEELAFLLTHKDPAVRDKIRQIRALYSPKKSESL